MKRLTNTITDCKSFEKTAKEFQNITKGFKWLQKKPEKAAAGLFWKMTDRDNFDETGEQQHNYKNRSLEAGPS